MSTVEPGAGAVIVYIAPKSQQQTSVIPRSLSGKEKRRHLSPAPCREKKKNEVLSACYVCYKPLDLNEQAISVVCKSGHHICSECAPNSTKYEMYTHAHFNPDALKCQHSKCNALLYVPSFIRYLTDVELRIHNTEVARSLASTTENDIVLQCPFCPYYELGSANDSESIACKRTPECGIVTCITCKLEMGKMTMWARNGDQMEGTPKNGRTLNEIIEKHLLECSPFKILKSKVEQIMDLSAKFPCPNCNFSGMKDDGCIHMRCAVCKLSWCYFCRKLSENSHECQGCPMANVGMFLNDISKIDNSWPEDSNECLAKLHGLYCLKALKELDTELNTEKLRFGGGGAPRDPSKSLDELMSKFPALFPTPELSLAAARSFDPSKPFFTQNTRKYLKPGHRDSGAELQSSQNLSNVFKIINYPEIRILASHALKNKITQQATHCSDPAE